MSEERTDERAYYLPDDVLPHGAVTVARGYVRGILYNDTPPLNEEQTAVNIARAVLQAVDWTPSPPDPISVPSEARETQDVLIERVRAALKPLGYAVAVHGSRARDLDLIAAPWVEDVECDPMAIFEALREAGFIETGMGGVASPHNRLGFALHGVPASAGVKYIDLSVLLPVDVEEVERKADRWCERANQAESEKLRAEAALSEALDLMVRFRNDELDPYEVDEPLLDDVCAFLRANGRLDG